MGEYIEPIERLIEKFRKLNGIGRKTAVRLAFSVLDFSDDEASDFAEALVCAKRDIKNCALCQNMTDSEICSVCSDIERDHSTICVVEDSRAVIAIERSHNFNGVYHVLHGAISPVHHIGPEQLKISELMSRLSTEKISEVILATNPTVEGETTAMYLSKLISPMGIKVTRIANGVPVGGDLEYTDEVTLGRALEGRYNI